MGKQILILGAGFGGLACANALRKGLGQEHRIVIVDRKKSFMMGLVKLWVIVVLTHIGNRFDYRHR